MARYIVFSQALLAIFIAGGIFFKRNTPKNWSIAIFVAMFGLEMIVFLYATSSIKYIYPGNEALLYLLPGFLYGPILYIHFKTTLHQDRFKLTRKELLHLIPFLLVLLINLDFLLLSGPSLEAFMQNHFSNRVMPINYARAAHQLIYAGILGYLIVGNYTKIGREKVFYLIVISVIYALATLIISFYTLFAETWRDFILYYFIVNFLILFLGYVLTYMPEFYKRIGGKYKTSNLNSADLRGIENQMNLIFEEEQLFLKNNLTIADVSKRLNVPSYQISQVLSSNIKMTFNQYVNKKRVGHAKTILSLPQNNKYKIEALAIEMGFNNKVTFYKAFKMYTGLTPSQFRKEIQREQDS